MTSVLVGCTVGPHVVRAGPSESMRWLDGAEALRERSAEAGVQVRFGLALEEAYYTPYGSEENPLVNTVKGLGGRVWRFGIEDGETTLSGQGRLHRICAGRNLVVEMLARGDDGWVLFLDSDVKIRPDAIVKLLEVDWPNVAGDIPSYCLSGEQVKENPETGTPYRFPVQRHWASAGFLMVRRDLALRVRWGRNPDEHLSDDPHYEAQLAAIGCPTLVRHDVIGDHGVLVPLEQRGHDLSL